MQSIGNSNQTHAIKNHPSENSMRPGNAGHPGKHLGQLKKPDVTPDQASSLAGKQLNALHVSGGSQAQKNSIPHTTVDHINDMNDAVAEQISFNSKMHAISTAFF